MFGINYAPGPGPDHNPKPTAHETAAVLRMHRSGMIAPKICSLLKISKQQLVHELSLAIDQEQDAHQAGMPIHDATAKLELETKSKYAKDIKVGEILPEHGAVVLEARPIYEGGTAPARIVFTLSTGLTFHYAAYDRLQVAPEE